MGNASSMGIDPVHIRIYSNLIQIENHPKRVQMINTCLAGMEFITSAKRAGIYSHLLNYVSAVNAGLQPPLLPGEQQPIKVQQASTPRAFQAPPQFSNPGIVTHPSISGGHGGNGGQGGQITQYSDNTPSWKVLNKKPCPIFQAV